MLGTDILRRTNARTSPPPGGGGVSTDWTEVTGDHITGSLTDGGSILKTLDYDAMGGYWRATLSATGAVRDGFNEWAYKEVALTSLFEDFTTWNGYGVEAYIEFVAQSYGTGSLYGPACCVLRSNQGYGIGIQDHAAGTDRVYKIVSGTIGSLVAGALNKVDLFYTQMWNGPAGYLTGAMADFENSTWVKRTPGESGLMGHTVDAGLTFRIGVMTTSATPPGEDETLDFRIYARTYQYGSWPVL